MKLKPNWREGRTPAEVRLIEQKLIELEKLYEDNPLAAVSFDKIPKQERYIGSRHFYKLLAAGNGFGKTFTGTVDDLIQLCDREVLPARLLKYKRWDPPFHMRIVVPKFGLAESVALEKFRELTPPAQLIGGNFDKAYDKVNRKLRFANGSWVVFNTSDQDVNAHAGVELHRVRFDEEPEGELGFRIYNENLMRLRKAMPDAQVCFTFTPQNGLGWTYELFWEERGEEVEPGVFEDDKMLIVVASMLDNPYIDGAALLEMANLPPEEYAARVEGKFVSFHGRVLNVRENHKVDRPSQRHVQSLQTWVGIDPGIARGGVVWVGFDRDNTALVYDELYPKDMTIPEIARAIEDKNREWGVKPVYVIDPSARNRALTNAESVESLFLKEGIPCLHGQNDRRAGVMQLRARLAQDGLFIAKNCTDLLKEAERWVVAEDEKIAEDKPSTGGDSFKTKGPDHLCLVGGTLVETEHGPLPIERVPTGMRVWTRDGLRRVTAAAMTDPDAEVSEVLLSDGRTLTGTDNHPVLALGRGWTDLGDLRPGDDVLVCREWKASSSTESRSVATQTRSSDLTASTSYRVAPTASAVWGDSTKRYGSPFTGRSPMAATFTTSTGTLATTPSPIWNASPLGNTFGSIGRRSAQSATANTWMASAPLPLNGTGAQKGARGTRSMHLGRSSRLSPWSTPARSAGASTSPAPRATTASARTLASRLGGASRVLMTWTASALSASRRSGSTSTAVPRPVPVRVVGVRKAGRSAVFSLSVDGTPEFFANGVLVHNCDPLRYVCMERLWYQSAEKSKKLWHPSMGGAPPASWFTHSVENSGPPTGSMT